MVEPENLLAEAEGAAIPPDPDRAAIELLGWLELHLDDAPVAIVTGFNEPYLPKTVNADAFLPNRLRSALGLEDNAARYARDAYQLTAILHSRDQVRLIAGRRNQHVEPVLAEHVRHECPHAIVVRPRMKAYSEASKAVFEVFEDTTPLVEAISVDEAFLDVGGLRRIAGEPLDIAARLRRNVRERVGPDFPVGVRFDAEEAIKDGYGLTDSKYMALRFAQLGADYVSLSAGGKFEDAIQKAGEPLYPYTGYSGDRTMPPASYPDGANVYLAEGVKRFLSAHGYATPVVTTGKINTPRLAEQILKIDGDNVTAVEWKKNEKKK